MNTEIIIRTIENSDRQWIKSIFNEFWGGDIIITKGFIHSFNDLDGFIATSNNEKVGLITYKITDKELEIVSLNSFRENKGIGSSLVDTIMTLARKQKLKRVWLLTTNDNVDALKFYQKRNFTLKNIYPDAIKLSRKLKRSIPLIGNYGIPIRDEIELEIIL
ncbi:MAG: GNAT family N-acetyltransferase [Actinomycetota bacterium]|nr:GNAT family N-acetyltransferase [Actinomycetota bacterium]